MIGLNEDLRLAWMVKATKKQTLKYYWKFCDLIDNSI